MSKSTPYQQPRLRLTYGFTRKGEAVSSKSYTIPDDSFTIRELFERYQKGAPLPIGIERPIRYSDDPTHDSLDLGRISRMDLSELADWHKRVKDTQHHISERLEALKAANDDQTTKKAQNAPKSE